MSLAIRQRQEEWMDQPAVDPRQLQTSLRFIRRINSILGYTRATLKHLERFSRGWERGKVVRILDVATGSGDVPRAILKWADRKGWDVRIVAVDRHAVTARSAAAGPGDSRSGNVQGGTGLPPGALNTPPGRAVPRGSGLPPGDFAATVPGDSRLTIVQADAFAMPFDEGSFDYAITSMFLHHLSDEEAVAVMAAMGRLARRGIIIADLLRRRRAYAWCVLFTLFANRMVQHDARASVAQAFNAREIVALRDRAGLAFARYHAHFGHRFVLAGERGADDESAVP